MSFEDIWAELKKLGIFPCDKKLEIEIDRFQMLRFKKSYFFECIRTSNGVELHNVFLAVSRQNDVSVDVQEIFFAGNIGLDGNARVRDQINNLTEIFTNFLRNIGEL